MHLDSHLFLKNYTEALIPGKTEESSMSVPYSMAVLENRPKISAHLPSKPEGGFRKNGKV